MWWLMAPKWALVNFLSEMSRDAICVDANMVWPHGFLKIKNPEGAYRKMFLTFTDEKGDIFVTFCRKIVFAAPLMLCLISGHALGLAVPMEIQQVVRDRSISIEQKKAALLEKASGSSDAAIKDYARFAVANLVSSKAQDDPVDLKVLAEVVEIYEAIYSSKQAEESLRLEAGLASAELNYAFLNDKERAAKRFVALTKGTYDDGNPLLSALWSNRVALKAAEVSIELGELERAEYLLDIVMDYDYVLVEDPKIYAEFYRLREAANRVYLGHYSGDLRALIDVEIAPHHPRQALERQIMVERLAPVSPSQINTELDIGVSSLGIKEEADVDSHISRSTLVDDVEFRHDDVQAANEKTVGEDKNRPVVILLIFIVFFVSTIAVYLVVLMIKSKKIKA